MFEPVEEWTKRPAEAVGWVAALQEGLTIVAGVILLYVLAFFWPYLVTSYDGTLLDAYFTGVLASGGMMLFVHGLLLWRYGYEGSGPWLKLASSVLLYLVLFMVSLSLTFLLFVFWLPASLAPEFFAVYHLVVLGFLVSVLFVVVSMRVFGGGLERPVLLGLGATVVVAAFVLGGVLPKEGTAQLALDTSFAGGDVASFFGPELFVPPLVFITFFVLRPVHLEARGPHLTRGRYYLGASLFCLGLVYLLYSVNLLLHASLGMPAVP